MPSLDPVWSAIVNASTVVTLLSFLVWLYSALALLQKRRQYERRLDLLPRSLGDERPAALIVGLAGGIRGAVDNFLQTERMDIKVIEEIKRDQMVKQEELPEILDELLEIKARLTDLGITELHLFYKGPVSLAAAIGAMVDNWVPTIVYSHDRTYEPALVISKQTILKG
jgi:hypothetical protein